METESIIIVSVLSAAWLLLLILVVVLFIQVSNLRRRLAQGQPTGRIRVQKLTMDNDKNHAFHNPGLAPGEELSRRGYSMYVGEDAESARPAAAPAPERQTGGQFVEELAKELDHRQQRQAAPPFLLQSIQETRKNRNLGNPVQNNGTNHPEHPMVNHADKHVGSHAGSHAGNHAGNYAGNQAGNHAGNQAGNYADNHVGNHGRQSETNPNFIY